MWRWDLARRFVTALWRRAREDRLADGAAGAAFYLILSIIPGLAAAASIYRVVTGDSIVGSVTAAVQGVIPEDAATVLDRYASSATRSGGAQGQSALESLVWFGILLWSANRGTKGMVGALNQIYDRVEARRMLHRIGITMLLTLGAVVSLIVLVPAVLLLPAMASALGLGSDRLWVVALRWPLMFVLAATAIAALYRIGPSRKEADWRWILLGSAVAAALWILFSLLLSGYVQWFGNLSRIYGSVGSVVAFMLWIWLSAVAVLVGAEVDATLSVMDEERRGPAQASKGRGADR